MAFGDRLGLGGLIVAFFGIAAFYLWPDKRWIGWMSLIAASSLAIVWLFIEFNDAIFSFRYNHPIGSTITVALCGGLLIGGLWWQLALKKSSLAVTEKTAVEKQLTSIPDLRVTDWERLPFPLFVGAKWTIHLHIKNRSDDPVKASVKYTINWVTGRTEYLDSVSRKSFEEQMWKKAVADQEKMSDSYLTIPGRMNDYWVPLDVPEPLTSEQLTSLHTKQTVYFMGRILDLKGNTLLEFSAHTGLDDRSILFSIDHNGLP